jgi:hypothetical protein
MAKKVVPETLLPRASGDSWQSPTTEVPVSSTPLLWKQCEQYESDLVDLEYGSTDGPIHKFLRSPLQTPETPGALEFSEDARVGTVKSQFGRAGASGLYCREASDSVGKNHNAVRAAELRHMESKRVQLEGDWVQTAFPREYEVEFRAIWSCLSRLVSPAPTTPQPWLDDAEQWTQSKISELSSTVEDLRTKSGILMAAQMKMADDREKEIARVLTTLKAEVDALNTLTTDLSKDLAHISKQSEALDLSCSGIDQRCSIVEKTFGKVLGLDTSVNASKVLSQAREIADQTLMDAELETVCSKPKEDAKLVLGSSRSLNAIRERLLSIRHALKTRQVGAHVAMKDGTPEAEADINVAEEMHAEVPHELELEDRSLESGLLLGPGDKEVTESGTTVLQQILDAGHSDNILGDEVTPSEVVPTKPVSSSNKKSPKKSRRRFSNDKEDWHPSPVGQKEKVLSPATCMSPVHTPTRSDRRPLSCVFPIERQATNATSSI